MNSDVLRDVLMSEKAGVQFAKDKAQLAESKVIGEGSAIEVLMNSEGWKIVDRDLVLIQEGLTYKLRYGTNLSKSQMDRYIDCINMAEQFRESPKKYITRMRMLIKRKQKGA